ncbi:hypothetical protein ACIRG8_30005 [Streptomyces sp. NPDC102359]|uniref:hypothetical protein n=1 Tax=Streptomyces sp. NPDC102359 TaxID=3366159 RepID=UPI00380EF59E
MTYEQVEAARAAAQKAETAFAELSVSQPQTRRAVNALNRAAVADLPADTPAARAAQIAAQDSVPGGRSRQHQQLPSPMRRAAITTNSIAETACVRCAPPCRTARAGACGKGALAGDPILAR